MQTATYRLIRAHPVRNKVSRSSPDRVGPAFPLVSRYMEPPAGIEPATPSLPWNHQEPLCEPPFPQVTPDRRGRSYRFSFGQVMRSLQSRLIAAGAGHHPAQRPPTQAAFLFDHLPLALGRRPQQSSEYKGSSARRSPPRRPPPRSVRSMAMGMSSAGGARRHVCATSREVDAPTSWSCALAGCT